jgi:hypothetical protein
MKQSEALTAIKKAFGKQYCLHPQAGVENCQGDIVRAHTIQRNTGLSRIARDGHVYNFLLHSRHPRTVTEDLKPTPVGINRASTFTGFCALHDDAVFAPIEKQPFQDTPEHAFLLAYRAISREVFVKSADMELGTIRRSLDKGREVEEQVLIQEFANLYEAGLSKGLEEIEGLKAHCDDMLLRREYSEVRYYIIRLKDTPEIMCSAVHQPEYDFRGNTLQELGHLDRPAKWMHFSLVATDDGGGVVFSWVDSDVCTKLIKSLHALPNDDVTHAIVRYASEFFENTYFSPAWWDDLPPATRRSLIRRQLTELPPLFEHPRSSKCLQDDGIRAVEWEVVSRATNLNL